MIDRAIQILAPYIQTIVGSLLIFGASHIIRKKEILCLEAMISEMLKALLDASSYGLSGLVFIILGSVVLMIFQASH